MSVALRATASLCAMLIAAASGLPVRAAQECRYSAEHGAPGQLQTLTRTLSVGEIHRQPLPALARLTNHGPHDIRLTFDGAAPRQLSRGAQEPARGRLRDGVALSSVECLPARTAGPALGAEAGTLARHGRFAEHPRQRPCTPGSAPRIMKPMPVALAPNPSPASGRGEHRDTLRVFHVHHAHRTAARGRPGDA